VLLDDAARQAIMGLIEEVDGLDPYRFNHVEIEGPSRDGSADPTQADVDAAAARVIELEQAQNDWRQAIADLGDLNSRVTYYLGAATTIVGLPAAQSDDPAALAEDDRLVNIDLRRRASFLADVYLPIAVTREQLLTQSLDHWRTALGVLEHDLQWQAYHAEVTGQTENPRKNRPQMILNDNAPSGRRAERVSEGAN